MPATACNEIRCQANARSSTPTLTKCPPSPQAVIASSLLVIRCMNRAQITDLVRDYAQSATEPFHVGPEGRNLRAVQLTVFDGGDKRCRDSH